MATYLMRLVNKRQMMGVSIWQILVQGCFHWREAVLKKRALIWWDYFFGISFMGCYSIIRNEVEYKIERTFIINNL
jgi:hypothetical protein